MMHSAIAPATTPSHQGLVPMVTQGEGDVEAGEAKLCLKRLIAVAELVRAKGDLMTPQAFQIVLEVAVQPGITAKALEKVVNLSQASISRNLAALSEYHRLGSPGLHLVETMQDPTEGRRKIVFLTKQGTDFVSKVLSAFSGDRVTFDSPTGRSFLSALHKTHSR